MMTTPTFAVGATPCGCPDAGQAQGPAPTPRGAAMRRAGGNVVVPLVMGLAVLMLVTALALFAAHQYQALQNEAAEAARARDAARSQLIAYEAARARADRLTTELAEAREAARQKTEELQDALQRETAGRECLRGNALRLLNNAPGLRVSAPTGGAVAADAARVATDTDLARWATRAGEQYAECQRRLDALIRWHAETGTEEQ